MTRTNPAEAGSDEVGTRVDRTPEVAHDTAAMTKGERDELAKLVKRRERTAKAGIEHRAAEVLADIEEQLAAKYAATRPEWAEITAQAERLVAEADAVIAHRCTELGIRPEFRPGLSLNWYQRGENADAKRRAELRKVAQTRLVADSKRARYEIEARTTDVLSELASGALHSAEAVRFLGTIPTALELMPALSLAALEEG